MSFFKNIIYNGSVQVSSILLNLILFPYITRVLGKEALGINSFGQAIAGYFVILGNLGISIYGAKVIAENRDDLINREVKFSQCITFQFVFNIISIFLFNVWVLTQEINQSIYLLFNFVLLASMTDLSWVYTGMERFDLIAVRNLLIKFVGVICVFLFIKNENQLFLFVLIQQSILFVSNIIFWIQLKKISLKIQFSPIKESIKYVFLPSLILFIPSVFTSIYLSLNKVMLGYLSDISQVAIYDYPNRLIRIVITFIGVIATVMMPRLAYLIHNKLFREYVDKIKMMIYSSLLITVPITFIFLLISTPLCAILFSSSFVGADNILSIVSPTLIYSGMGLYVVFVTLNRVKSLILSTLIASIINILFNIILIPKYDAMGAAVSTFLTETVVHLFLIYFLRDIIPMKWIFKYLFSFLLIGLSSWFGVNMFVYNLNIKFDILNVVVFISLYIIGVIIFQRKNICNYLNDSNLIYVKFLNLLRNKK